jgi:hypothetical protein
MANEFRFEDHPDPIKSTPVTDEAISDLASQYGLEFSDEYRAFLKAHNGFKFDGLNNVAPLAPGIETFDYIRYLFGIDTGFEYNDLRAHLAISGVWEHPFRAFAYPVADGPGGDAIVQIFKGKAKGKIYFVDHEVLPEAEDLEAQNLEADGIDAADPDQALAFLIDEQGCFIEVAKSFSDFINKLVVYRDKDGINISIRRPLA